MVEADDRHLSHPFEPRSLESPVSSKDHIAFVDNERIQEPKLPYAGGDLTDLPTRVRPGIFGIGAIVATGAHSVSGARVASLLSSTRFEAAYSFGASCSVPGSGQLHAL
jgi:hypothetical protein